jgi:hypothetical protein
VQQPAPVVHYDQFAGTIINNFGAACQSAAEAMANSSVLPGMIFPPLFRPEQGASTSGERQGAGSAEFAFGSLLLIVLFTLFLVINKTIRYVVVAARVGAQLVSSRSMLTLCVFIC